jgi:hypothetical protein
LIRLGLFAVVLTLAAGSARAQNFTRITAGDVVNDLLYSEGAFWKDLDGDDDLDLLVTNITGHDNLLYRNDGSGGFALVTTGPVVNDGGFSYGGCWVDFDEDGDGDIFVINGGQAQPTALNFYYRNDGGTFAKVTTGVLVTDGGGSWSSAAADYDLDGDLDVFVANYAQNNALYRNEGGGSFAKITTGNVVTDGGSSLGSAWADYDGDGDPDLFVANADFGAGEANFLYRNEGSGSFTRIVTGDIASDAKNTVGASWADPDNDGDLDLLATNYSNTNNFYYRNDGEDSFARVNFDVGLNDGGSSVGGAWGDWDNDGWLDLFVSNDNNQNNLLYGNDGDGTFTRVLNGDIVSNGGRSNASVWGDIDADGDPDLFVTNGAAPTPQSNFLYRNDGSAGSNAWLHVRCVGVQSNRSAIGARVRVKATIDGQPVWQLREVSSQTGYNSMNSLAAEFGLGDATVVDSLVIDWPLGQQDVYTGMGTNRAIRLVEGSDPTGVEVTSSGPSRPVLGQNLPNPFRETTEIPFTLPRPVHVSLSVVDVAGRRVATLVDGAREAGIHRTRFEARGLPGGVYFAVLRVGGREEARGMIRVR